MHILLVRPALVICLATISQPALLHAQNTPVTTASAASAQDRLQSIIRDASARFAIPERWIVEVIRAESNGKRRAVSYKGARGLMQIMPATWEILRRRYRLKNAPYDPRQNIMAGTAYLREMYDKFGYPGCLAAYNAGPGRYASWVSGKQRLPRETINYVNLITSRIGRGPSFIANNSSPLAKPNAVRPAQSALFISSAVAKREQQDTQILAPKDAKPDSVKHPAQGLFVPLSGNKKPE